MLKNGSYKEKFSLLLPWMPWIIEAIKKDLKNDHLKKDFAFVKEYLPGKNPAKLTTEEMVQAYSVALSNEETAEELAEFISNKWLLKNSELYYFFEKELKKINPNFQEIELIDPTVSQAIMEEAIQEFGAPQAYLFCVLNSVAFPEKTYTMLSQRAEQSAHQAQIETHNEAAHQSLEGLQKSFELQIARLTDKYEKKLMGLQKKYTNDVESLKKQVASLQRKLNA